MRMYTQSTMVDEATKKTLASIPLLRTNAGPRDGDQWATRLKEEYLSLIKVADLHVLSLKTGVRSSTVSNFMLMG